MQERKSSFRDASIGYLSLRIFLGLVIFLHGVVRLAGHYEQFVHSTVQGFLKSPLPIVAVHVAALCIPPAEAVIGLFLLLGFLTRLALVGGALLMLVLLSANRCSRTGVRLRFNSSMPFFTLCCSP